jgi:hypothetical protein
MPIFNQNFPRLGRACKGLGRACEGTGEGGRTGERSAAPAHVTIP